MKKFVRVMDGLTSNAGGFEYKLDEVNVARTWNPKANDPSEFGGFNFGTEDKILRWLHRGNTIYDVIIPDDAENVLVGEEKGVYRCNKIIVTNPRPLTDDLIKHLIDITTLSNKVLGECLVVLLWKNHLNMSLYLIDTKVNKDNIDEIYNSFTSYAKDNNLNETSYKEINDAFIKKRKELDELNR